MQRTGSGMKKAVEQFRIDLQLKQYFHRTVMKL